MDVPWKYYAKGQKSVQRDYKMSDYQSKESESQD